jgi:hypothetical protein
MSVGYYVLMSPRYDDLIIGLYASDVKHLKVVVGHHHMGACLLSLVLHDAS